ncbi:hypothetical protein GCM10027088_15600 [Nocardia goodfellowii]
MGATVKQWIWLLVAAGVLVTSIAFGIDQLSMDSPAIGTDTPICMYHSPHVINSEFQTETVCAQPGYVPDPLTR